MPKKYLIVGAAAIAVLLMAALILMGRNTDNEAGLSLSENISPQDYQREFLEKETPHLLLDVRTVEEYSEGHIRASVNISLQSLGDNLDQIPTDQPIVIYCRSGNRSAQAADLLRAAGYSQIYDLGGVIGWQAAGYELIQ